MEVFNLLLNYLPFFKVASDLLFQTFFFLLLVANLIDWQPADEGSGTGMGKYGTCCTEMDIFEANNMAYSYTPHVCTNEGPLRCNGTECGDINDDDPSSRYNGVCDKDGCDFAPYRLGNTDFYGVGSDFTIDTSKKFTVVTQFITDDGTDDGDLIEIKRFFVQDGKTVENPTVDIDGQKFSSVTDDFCKAEKAAFGDTDAFTKNGGLKAMGDSMDRGMVLVLSLWDDNYASLDGLMLQRCMAVGVAFVARPAAALQRGQAPRLIQGACPGAFCWLRPPRCNSRSRRG